MEYVNGISLREFYQKFKEKKISEEICKKIFYDICDGMAYLHMNHMAHRDIKLENILITDKNDIKIIDFGFGMFAPDDSLQNFFCGTPNYMPPEIVVKQSYKGDRADLWSLGILLYKMLVGEFPFKGETEKDLYKTIQKGKFKIPQFISEDAKKILISLIQLKPEKRMNCKGVLENGWFKEIKEREEKNANKKEEDKKEDINTIEEKKTIKENKEITEKPIDEEKTIITDTNNKEIIKDCPVKEEEVKDLNIENPPIQTKPLPIEEETKPIEEEIKEEQHPYIEHSIHKEEINKESIPKIPNENLPRPLPIKAKKEEEKVQFKLSEKEEQILKDNVFGNKPKYCEPISEEEKSSTKPQSNPISNDTDDIIQNNNNSL